MHCGYPRAIGGRQVPCSQCMPCRVNHQRMLTLRMLLEERVSLATYFITLTYNALNVPLDDHGRMVLCKDDLAKFWKRLRYYHDEPIRYFACGEYGSRTWRPHYHAIVFLQVPFSDFEKAIETAWTDRQGLPLGFTSVAPSNAHRMAYTANYTLKKMFNRNDPKTIERLEGRPPEFSTRSRRPGIGVPAVPALAAMYLTRKGQRALELKPDINVSVRIDSKTYPMDTLLRSKLRERLGIPLTRRERDAVYQPDEGECVIDWEQAMMSESARLGRKQEHLLKRQAEFHGTL